jgi:hypothetical protein
MKLLRIDNLFMIKHLIPAKSMTSPQKARKLNKDNDDLDL